MGRHRRKRRMARPKNDRGRVLGEHSGNAHRMRNDFRVHMRFTHPPRNELRVLRAKIDDKDWARILNAHM